MKREREYSDNASNTSESGSESSSSSTSSGSDERARKREKKERKKEKKRRKAKKEKKERKQSKKNKSVKKEKMAKKKKRSKAEEQTQSMIDLLDQQAREFAEVNGEAAPRLSATEQASLLSADLATRATALGLPKGLIRTTGAASSSGLFSGSGQFGDKQTRRALSGGFGGDSNPATEARLKRERQAQKATRRAHEILEERRASAAGAQSTGPGLATLGNRFSSGTTQH
mmetsp:Transcript_47390/g.107416  ORF Transcript_47390/g.107416 Transcript_47390/m.107416 type:complete len:229 (-) Transcript_47390:107-793(-)